MKKKQKKQLKMILGVLLIVALVALINVSLDEYRRQTEAIGIIVCSDEECIKTMHIHADIVFDLCGQSVSLPREVGPLSGLHTHKERNYLHFHDEVALDPATRVLEFDERLSIQEVIDVFELTPEKYCGTNDVEITVMVNGEAPEEGLEYNWKDGDLIELRYSAR